jgi:hypothetical protein
MQAIIDFISANWATIATILFLISELLGSIPAFKSNSIFQFIVGLLKPKA